MGTEVKLSEYALAVAGILQGLERIGNVLVAAAYKRWATQGTRRVARINQAARSYGIEFQNSGTQVRDEIPVDIDNQLGVLRGEGAHAAIGSCRKDGSRGFDPAVN